MSNFFSQVVDNLQQVFESVPWLRDLFVATVSLSLFMLCFRTLMNLILLDRRIDFGDVLYSFGHWIKDKFTDFLKLFVSFDTLYKLGLAREGVDFVTCSETDCNACPFAGECNREKATE